MNRKGLWAGGVALILLVVVGAAALLTTDGAGYAKDEDDSAGRSALMPRSRGRICSPLMELKSREMSSSRSPTPAMWSLTATVRRKASFPLTLTGRFLVRNPSPARTLSRRIAQAPPSFRMARITISSSLPMALS